MRGRRMTVAFAALCLIGTGSASAQFSYGDIFVTVIETEGCDFGYEEAIVRIDPTTGAMSVFADTDDGMCNSSGLRFTPDGERLLQLSSGHFVPPGELGWILSFDAEGNGEIILDGSDGLGLPNGANGLAFDADGNLYVLNSSSSTILRFPADGGPGTVFADSSDGIFGRGALDFAPTGDLFYCGEFAEGIIRINPQGEGSLFDDPPGNPSSLAFDRFGNLFVGSSGLILRYDNADPDAGHLLASGFIAASGIPLPLTLSPDGTVVYVAEIFGRVYAVDAEDGTTTVLADVADLPLWDSIVLLTGISVHAPVIPGDMDADGDVDLVDFGAFDLCRTGPGGGPVSPECQPGDSDGDGDVDWADFALFQLAFGGP